MSNTNRQLGAAEIFAGITAALALAFPIATLFAAFTWRWRRDKARDLSSKRREVMITVASFGVALTFFSGAYSSGWSSVAHFVIGGHAEHSLFVALILMVPLSVPVGLIAGALGRDFYIWQRKRHPIHGRSIRELEAKHSVWWAPILLEDIILHFYGFALCIVEYTSFDNKQAAW